MQLNMETLKPEIECLTCIYNRKDFCECIIFSGDLKLKNLYHKRK